MTLPHVSPLLPAAADAAGHVLRGRSIGGWAHLLAFGAVGWPWLLRSLSGGSRAEKAALLARLDLPADALPHLGGWKADVRFLAALVDRIEATRPATVVEFGAGASTLVAAAALARNGGGRLISFDQYAAFAEATAASLGRHGLTAEVRVAPLRAAPGGWPGLWYDHDALPERIDLLVIDGPPWIVHPYVRGAAESLFGRLPVGGALLLDDAARPGERVVARRWRARWPGIRFTMLPGGSKGVLLGERAE